MKTRIRSFCLLLLLWIFHLINNIIWLAKDRIGPYADSAWFLECGHIYINRLADSFKLFWFLLTFQPHAPLVPIMLIPKYLLFGNGADSSIILLNSVFWGILIIGMFFLAKELDLGDKGAAFSVILLSLYPPIFVMNHHLLLATPLLALTVWFIYVLLQTEDFSNRRKSLNLGIIMGIGFLVKQSFGIYILFPLVFIVFRAFCNSRTKGEVLKNITITSISAFIICGWWYIPNAMKTFWWIGHIQGFESNLAQMPGLFSLNSILFYPKMILLGLGILSIPFLLFLFNGKSMNGNSRWHLVFTWILGSFFILTLFIKWKDIRYLVPFLGGISLLSSSFAYGLKNKYARKVFVFSFIFIGLLQFFICNYTRIPEKFIPELRIMRTQKSNWRTSEILEFIRNYSDKAGLDVPTLVVVPLEFGFSVRTFSYLSEKRKMNIVCTQTAWQEDPFFFLNEETPIFLITKHPLVPQLFVSENIVSKQIKPVYSHISDNSNNFTLIHQFNLPDNANANLYLYQR